MADTLTTEKWIDELKNISVLELSERIKALEEEFGVSATAVAAAAPAAGGGCPTLLCRRAPPAGHHAGHARRLCHRAGLLEILLAVLAITRRMKSNIR